MVCFIYCKLISPLIVFFSIIVVINGRVITKSMEGYPAGYLFDCPNVTLTDPPTQFTTKQKKSLYIVVHGVKSAKKIKYNYYQMHLMGKDSSMDWTKKTVLYVGGYLDSPTAYYGTEIEKRYSDLGYNVWMLDTLHLTLANYIVTPRRIRVAGYAAGEMLANLTQSGVLDLKTLEVVGFSLGGHTAGFIAKRFYQVTGKKLPRITAIDPSGSCFRYQPQENRLDDTDAEFVDVIHTNIDGYGIAAPLGHVDFYVNGGEYQNNVLTVVPCNIACSHLRAFELWKSALEHPHSFIAFRCESVQQARYKSCYDNKPLVKNVMGLGTNKTKQGIFYLPTTALPPYYMGRRGLLKENEPFRVHNKKILAYYGI